MKEFKSGKNLKRNLILAAVLFFVCGAAYLNWSFNNKWGRADSAMARAEDGSFSPTARPTPGHPNTDEGFAAFEAMSAFGQGPLVLSEAMAGNSSILPQEDGSYPDWIELHNNGPEPIPLSGYALSDNPNNPAQWVFPEGTSIGPGGYITVLATGSSNAGSSELATNFALNSEGDMVLLFSPEGQVLDKLRLGPARSGMSIGRESGKLRYYEAPTPGEENGPGAEGVTSEPRFETLPGIYDGPITVALAAAPGETIHYTLDCTEPTADSPVYTGPIPISENTVIRAVALREGYVTGYTVSGTFLLRTDGVNHSLPIATLVLEPDDLWDSDTNMAYTPSSDNTKNTSVFITEDVSMRSDAGSRYTVVGYLKRGTTVSFTGYKKKDSSGNQWYQVKYQGTSGWVPSSCAVIY